MAILNLKQWLRDNIKPYLAQIKASMGSISGEFRGTSSTVSGFPTTAKLNDWVILSSDDGGNESGIYAYNGTTWGFAMDLVLFNEIIEAVQASEAEADDVNEDEKFMLVSQIYARFAKINGDSTEKFSASAPEEQTNEVVRANDFDFTINATEAQSDWDNA